MAKTAKNSQTKEALIESIISEANTETVETVETVETEKIEKPKAVKVPVSKFAKFNHLASVLGIEDTTAVKNFMLFNLASKKSKVNFNEYAMEVLYKYSMDPEFKAKVETYI